ncbi:MAG: TetR family transcriptional regulator C-terminal domain-containing protein, partial [Ruminococcus flavefaciens]|nr:TetR family transcriptional regulator C-terminal domain-containing protein [Ruminococcus flavefaciens]
RSTFYLHYESMNDLLDESLSNIFSQFTCRYDELSISKKELSTCPIDELFLITPQYIIPYLQFLKDNAKAFMASLSKPDTFGVKKSFNAIYQEVFSPILERFSVPEKERKYLLIFYISGMHAIIIEWLKGGCIEEMEYIADLLVRYAMKIK